MARRLQITWLAKKIEDKMKEKNIQNKSFFIRIFKDKVIFFLHYFIKI